MAIETLVLFGDDLGIPQLLRHVEPSFVRAIVGAAIRPHQHAALEASAKAASVPLLIQPRIDSDRYARWVSDLEQLAPDMILVDSYSMLLRPEVLAIPPAGAVNLHGALLPDYRGANPIQWALLNGERETGVTMHHMTETVDAGDIVAQCRVPILFEDTWADVHRRIIEATDELLADVLPALLSGTAPRVPQDEVSAHTYPRRRPEDGRVDWDQPARGIYDLVRALVAPHPGAFYETSDQRRVVLDRFLPLADIVKLKYSPEGGGHTLSVGLVVLEPEPHETSGRVSFRIVRKGEIVGLAAIDGLDAGDERARVSIEGAEDAALRATLVAFADHELGVEIADG